MSFKLRDVFQILWCFSNFAVSFKLCNVFQTSHGLNLDWDLPIHTKFDDHDFASKSQMYWKLANHIFMTFVSFLSDLV